MKKSLFIIAALLLSSIASNAQIMKIYKGETLVATFNESEADKVVFEGSNKGDDNDSANGHEYVDLGLSVMWATCNVGATNPEDYGDYFAWGETEAKSRFSWDTYNLCNGSGSKLTKYCTDALFGTCDNKTILELADDAANVQWGGNWRMPSPEEQLELVNNCTWTWTTKNEINGYEVKSNKNGNSIFIPAAGYYTGTTRLSAKNYGFYWLNAIAPETPKTAGYLTFNNINVYRGWYERCSGRSVRPVLTK